MTRRVCVITGSRADYGLLKPLLKGIHDDDGLDLGDLDDFDAACEELSHLQWIELDRVREFDLPFITEVVLAEIDARLGDGGARPIPFFFTQDGKSFIDKI